MTRIFSACFILLLLIMVGCSDPVFTPKPRSYPRVVYPEKTYQRFAENFCNFSFEYPTYTVVQQDTAFFDELPPNDCWFDIFYPDYDGRIHFTYVPVGAGGQDLETLTKEAFGMADWHNKRANYIEELRIQTDYGVNGMAFNIDGPAASPFQFFLTDSTTHYVRGALYFNTQSRADSLAPVIDFVREDILHLIESFRWKE